MNFRLDVYHHIDFAADEIKPRLDQIIAALGALTTGQTTMSNDLTALQATLTALEAKAAETNVTLTGLAQAVLDLKNAQPADVQAAIDALTAQAQGILDGLTVAEDAADDQLPTPPAP